MPRFETPVGLPSDPSEDLEAATKQYVDSQAGGASELSDLTDVDTDGVANNDFLRYSESAGEWLPVAVSPGSGAETLDDLNDVDVPSVVEGDMLYLNDSGLWVVVSGTKDEGRVPTIQGDGSVAWGTPAGGGGGGLLGLTSYNPATAVTLTTTSATFADVDADELAVSFTVPASGTVLVRLTGDGRMNSSNSSHVYYWGLRDGASDVPASAMFAGVQNNNTRNRMSAATVIGGLTPSASLTWKWSHARIVGGTGELRAGQSNDTGPAVMEVWAA